MNRELHDYRDSYEQGELLLENALDNPLDQFALWFDEVEKAGGVREVNAMTVATVDPSGMPKSRIVLLKSYDSKGFVFYTNYNSEKGQAIQEHPKVSLSFFWPNLERQVIIQGTAQKVSAAQSDDYFNKRPKGSQLGALASPQSTIIADRAVLEQHMSDLKTQYENRDVKRPDHWGGFVIQPLVYEFWQGRPSRLHDRIRYSSSEKSSLWLKERLAP